jgi:hypothetical protein
MTNHLKTKSSVVLRTVIAGLSLVLPINVAYAEPPEIIKAEVDALKQNVTITGHDFGVTTGRVGLVGSRGTVDDWR